MKTKFIFMLLILTLFGLPAAIFAQLSTFSKVFGGQFNPMLGSSMVNTFDSNYLVTGEKSGQALLFKIDPAGNLVSGNTMIFSGYFEARLTRINRTHDSCFVAVGNLDNDNILCMKFSPVGDTLWSKSIDLGFKESANFIFETNDHGFLIAGSSYQDITPPYSKMTVVKLDESGNLAWVTHLTVGSFENQANSAKQTPDGGYIVIGNMEHSMDASVATLIKLTPAGAVLWSKTMEMPSFPVSAGFDIVVTNNGFNILADVPGKGTLLIKTDFSGNPIWSRYYIPGSNSYTSRDMATPSLLTTHDGGFAFVASGLMGNMFKTDSAGIMEWSRGVRLDVMNMIESIDQGFITFGNGPIYGVKLSGQTWPVGYQIGIIKSDSFGHSVNCIETTWDYSDTCSINFLPVAIGSSTPAATVVALYPLIDNFVPVSFTGCIDVFGGCEENCTLDDGFVIFPNPIRKSVKVQFKNPNNPGFQHLTLFNIVGENVFQSSDPQIFLSETELPSLPCGIYMVHIVFLQKSYYRKVLISP